MKLQDFEIYYTVEEVAMFLRVSPRTVYRWIDEGKIFAYHLSEPFEGKSKKIIPHRAIKEFLQKNTPSHSIQKLKQNKNLLKELLQKLNKENDISKIKESLQMLTTLI